MICRQRIIWRIVHDIIKDPTDIALKDLLRTKLANSIAHWEAFVFINEGVVSTL